VLAIVGFSGYALAQAPAPKWQGGETGKAVGANGLQAGWNGQGYQNLGRRLCERARASRYPTQGRTRRASASAGNQSAGR
jgi:hypothetical protein